MPKDRKPAKPEADDSSGGQWLPTRTGLYILTFVSLVLAAWTTWQVSSALSPLESILWGLGFGASIWLVFALVFVVNRWLRRG